MAGPCVRTRTKYGALCAVTRRAGVNFPDFVVARRSKTPDIRHSSLLESRKNCLPALTPPKLIAGFRAPLVSVHSSHWRCPGATKPQRLRSGGGIEHALRNQNDSRRRLALRTPRPGKRLTESSPLTGLLNLRYSCDERIKFRWVDVTDGHQAKFYRSPRTNREAGMRASWCYSEAAGPLGNEHRRLMLVNIEDEQCHRLAFEIDKVGAAKRCIRRECVGSGRLKLNGSRP